MNRNWIVYSALVLMITLPAAGDTIDDQFRKLGRQVSKMIEPVPGQSRMTVVIADPLITVRDEYVRRRVQQAFATEFFTPLLQRRGTAVTFVDDDFFPQLKRIYEVEFQRLITNSNSSSRAREIHNEYLSHGSYDYLILTRVRPVGNEMEILSQVLSRSQLTDTAMVSAETGRVKAEEWRLTTGANTYQIKLDRKGVFRNSQGQLVAFPSAPELSAAGLFVESKSPRFYFDFTYLGVSEPETEIGEVVYSAVDQRGTIEGIVARVRRIGLLAGFEYSSTTQEYSRERDEFPLFSIQSEQFSGGLGLAYNNLYNGFSVSVWAVQGTTNDETPDRFARRGEMWTEEGLAARFRYNYTKQANEFAFTVTVGESEIEFDPTYYGTSFTGDSQDYSVDLRYRRRMGKTLLGVFGAIAESTYDESLGGPFSESFNDTREVFGVEFSFFIGGGNE